MTARSTMVVLNNITSETLNLTFSHLDGGTWTTNVLPPQNIAPGARGTWQSESNGFATGTAGTVKYSLSGEDVIISWDNPFVGTNSYNTTAPSGYKITQDAGSGTNAGVTFTLSKVKETTK